MPVGLRPMLAQLAKMPAEEERYGFEIKWDGVRALAYVQRGRIRLESRTGRDISAQFPEARGLAAALGRRQVVLDGELVAFDEAGRPSFQRLQGRMHLASPQEIPEGMGANP